MNTRTSTAHPLKSRLSLLCLLLGLLTLTACDSGGGGNENPAPPENGENATPQSDNKQAGITLTSAPVAVQKYVVIVNVADALPGTQVQQSNAQATRNGVVGNSGVYQREHFSYEAGSGKITVLVTLTDPNGEVLLKEVSTTLPGKAPGNLAP